MWGKNKEAEFYGDLSDRAISGFSISTKTLQPGEIFIALQGTRQDGHDFVQDAFYKWATGAMVSRSWFTRHQNKRQKNIFDSNFMIVVDDPLTSLQSLAKWHRSTFQCPIIGITGSNGKTTTKEMLAKILGMRGPVLKTEGNLNNQIGLPLTLLRLKKEHQAAVLEMGISRPCDMRLLCDIAKPTMGIITNIGAAHLEFLGNMQGVADEKTVLFEALPPNGITIINQDDPYLSPWEDTRLGHDTLSEKWTYAIVNDADLIATEIVSNRNGIAFTLALNRNQKGGGGKMKVGLSLLGEHQVYNALAASAGALALGYEFDEIRSALQDISPMPLRGEIIEWNGATILLDAYNANPASMQAALLTLAGVAPFADTASAGHRKVAILGDMLELGNAAKSAHKELGRKVAQNRIDRLIAVGQFCEIVACGALGKGMQKQAITTFKNLESLDLAHEIQSGDVVLIKGSRGMGMERLLNARGRDKVAAY
jgi:UDP-N-acetylmuramoyl-tripeptide--D-alanyl-D-alanine ligase